MLIRRTCLVLTILVAATSSATAGPKVHIATGPQPHPVIKLAGDELAAQLKTLFDAEVTIAEAPADSPNLILLGSPGRNPAIRSAMNGQWPEELSEDGHLVRSIPLGDKKALVVGGGSEIGILFAVHELGHHFGLRYLLSGDMVPPAKPEFKLDGINILRDHNVTERAWLIPDSSLTGLAAWSTADREKFVGQLAKLNFNQIMTSAAALDGSLYARGPFPIDGETPGRKAFQGAKTFGNPDASNAKTPDDRRQAAAALDKDLERIAAKFGMKFVRQQPGKNVLDEKEAAAVNRGEPLSKWSHELMVPLWLTHANLAPLPQIHAQRIHTLLAEMRKQGRPGFVASAEMTGDLDPVVHYLSRACFDAKLTPEQTYDDLFTIMCGRNDVTGRLTLAFKLIEEGNDKIAATQIPLGGADRDLSELLKSSASQADLLKEISKIVGNASNEMFRAHGNCDPSNRKPLYYYAKRSELGVQYMACVTALDAAADARRKGEKDAAVEQLEKAVEALYNGLNSLGEVARDPSDRGVIAVFTENGYRPLYAELEKATSE